ncbi:hypothetical protein [Stenotrophomonas sp. BIGb0135]|uniref:hypothetical protein n=1 Tax=Stenotrophomonas sp. BIGb0135 TaxID=2940620 RepID=UPI0021695ACC|nr:hypothetical protein [Stenotrophomonas sp. BIGb0135]MCS4235466.1 hypothetical protein [Stenotrophomonas sp. BIGb0135]
MPLNFTPQPGSAVDQDNRVVITSPRVLPASPPEDPSHDEYQYLFYVDGVRVDGLGLFGSEAMMEAEGGHERVFTLDMGRDWVLESVFSFKRILGSTDEDLTFLIGLAQGLVMANMDQSSSKYSIRYVAVTTDDALSRRGINPSQMNLPSEAGRIVLAEGRIPVRAD